MARNREVGLDDHPPSAINWAPTAIRQQLAEMGRAHPRTPADGGSLQHPLGRCARRRFLESHGETARLHALHPAPQDQLHSLGDQVIAGGLGELRRHRPQHPIAGIHQDHAAGLRIQLAEIAAGSLVHQLVEGSGQLTAGGTSADHQHGLQEAPALRIRCLLRLLQSRKHPSADLIGVLKDLHRRRQWTPLLMAEIGAAGTGGQDQAVVTQAAVVEDHLPGVGIKIDHLPEQHLHIGRLGQHQPQRRGHIRLGHQAGSHLVQQGLEEVEVALVHQGHPHRLAGEPMGRLEPGEAPAHDHHVGPALHHGFARLQLEEEAFLRHRSDRENAREEDARKLVAFPIDKPCPARMQTLSPPHCRDAQRPAGVRQQRRRR